MNKLTDFDNLAYVRVLSFKRLTQFSSEIISWLSFKKKTISVDFFYFLFFLFFKIYREILIYFFLILKLKFLIQWPEDTNLWCHLHYVEDLISIN